MKCKHCGEIHPAEFLFCPNTGNKIEPEKLVCKVCGKNDIKGDLEENSRKVAVR